MFELIISITNLACKYQTQKNGDGQLAMAEEYDVEKVWVSWMLQEKPKMQRSLEHFIFFFCKTPFSLG